MKKQRESAPYSEGKPGWNQDAAMEEYATLNPSGGGSSRPNNSGEVSLQMQQIGSHIPEVDPGRGTGSFGKVPEGRFGESGTHPLTQEEENELAVKRTLGMI